MRCWPNRGRGWTRHENQRIHPRTQRKGATAIAHETPTRIEAIVAKRREHAKTRAGYVSLLLRVLALALAVWLILTFAFTFTQVHGQSMAPALKDGDLCVVFRTGLQQGLGGGFQKDDVVACRREGARFIGRVAAVAGDTVEITEGGTLVVNGVTQSGSVRPQTDAQGNPESGFTVPQGCLYILSDNRSDAQDTRNDGLIPLNSVDGKVITILRRRGI